MELESPEVPPDNGQGPLERKQKRIAKTRPQVQALEKFYNEHKYPTEAMKLQVAESVGLTEKQVSGWFCHRRLKDKKFMNGEIYPAGRQDRSSGVVQDHCSGHRQDSCGSTKQAGDRILDTKEVESDRLIPKEHFAADNTCKNDNYLAGNYNHSGNISSGSSSSLKHGSNHWDRKPFGAAAASTFLIPKCPTDVKSSKMKPGPSGYLKVKGRVENPAITAVKRNLGKHYRDDGPPLAVEFDLLPPGAFEPIPRDPVEDTCYSGEGGYNASDAAAKTISSDKFGKGYEYKSSMASYNSTADRMSFEVSRGHDIRGSYIHHQNIKPKASSSCYHAGSYTSEVPEGFDRFWPGGDSRLEYKMKSREHDDTGIGESFPRHPHLQPYSGKAREEPVDSSFSQCGDMSTQTPLRQNVDTEYANLSMNRKRHGHSGDKLLSRQIIKDRYMYPDNITLDQSQIKTPFNESTVAVQMGKVFHAHQKSSSVMRFATEMASSFSEDEESADTTSSMD